jgi:hypothetical protein
MNRVWFDNLTKRDARLLCSWWSGNFFYPRMPIKSVRYFVQQDPGTIGLSKRRRRYQLIREEES